VTAAVVAAATVTYALVEVPGIRLGRWLIGRLDSPGASAGPRGVTAA
jgi:peptidoglycan/LPS O-acetylase OafA/YrhL